MARISRILAVMFVVTVALFVAVAATDGHPENILDELDDLRRRLIG